MPNSFDLPPTYDRLADKSGIMTSSWILWFGAFLDNLSAYITEFGITPPNLTTAQRDTIQSPNNGQEIYNITIDAPQFYQVSSKSWRTITFT